MQYKSSHQRLHNGRRHVSYSSVDSIGHVSEHTIEPPSRVVVERDLTLQIRAVTSSTCPPDSDDPRCQKPVSDGHGTTTIPIILGAAIPVVAAIVVLLYLHRRNKKKLRLEDKMDKTKSMDFGLGTPSSRGESSSRSMNNGVEDIEKPGHKKQFSMDMDLGAPYLLPPELNTSHESLHSLSRAYHSNEDRYRPATAFSAHSGNPVSPGSGGASIRSVPQSQFPQRRGNRDSSLYTASIRQADDDYTTDSPTADLIQHPAKFSQSSPATRMASMSNQPTMTESEDGGSVVLPKQAVIKDNQDKSRHDFLFASPSDERDSYIDKDGGDLRRSHLHLAAHIGVGQEGVSTEVGKASGSSSSGDNATGGQCELPASGPTEMDQQRSGNINHSNVNHNSAFFVTPPSPKEAAAALDFTMPELPADGPARPETQEMNPRHPSVMGGLEVNRHDSYRLSNRLSMGFRPLPPAPEPGDTAEERAMRIRSFYKEYFEDSNPTGNNVTEQPVQMPYHEDYYDDYYGDYYQDNENEHGDFRRSYFADDCAPVYDEQSGQFIMAGQRPFAEPPMRRAMTPPPRMPPPFQRPAMNGPPANFYPPHPRSYSSASGRFAGPQGPHRGPPPPRRPMKPAEPLQILPSPHLIKDDTFASPIGFAPAPRVREYQSGTASETGSLRGGVRPYSPAVPAHIPLASSFDELNVLPTPHQLRKSGTFTGLDFAPPRRFGAGTDTMSDTGSIRSNRTGMSNVYGIRSGAYRVSRLPPEVVPTKDDMVSNLRPTWDMRSPGA